MDFIAKYCYTLTCFCSRFLRGQSSKTICLLPQITLDSERSDIVDFPINIEFPEELLVNIVVRLPLKDIFRFKLVSKSWLKLITSSNPYFISNYVRNSPFTIIFRSQGRYGNPNKLSFSLIEFAGKGGGEHTHIPFTTTPKIPDHQGSDSRLSLIGSCDCSVFILHSKRFNRFFFNRRASRMMNRVYLFNPVSGSCVKVVSDDRAGEEERWVYKVGFIPSNNTYKLVRYVPGSTRKVDNPEIFAVGLDKKWRKVDDDLLLFYGAFNYPERVICFNGVYHWLSFSENDDDDKIFTFHLLEEKSGAGIPKPPHGVSRRLSRLTILNGRLSVANLSDDLTTMVIWTMREYGVMESWSRVVVLTLGDENPEKSRCCYLVPIAVLVKNGDVLFAEKSGNGGIWV